MYSEAIEDYLQAIYQIEAKRQHVSTTALAERMQVKPASATAMLQRLSKMGLVAYQPYQGAVLSPEGRKRALEIIRHHQLIESLLVEVLNVPWDRVHEEAHRIEHTLSEYLEARIDAILGHPTTCPHGAPIPKPDGTVAPLSWVRLSELHAGQVATVSRVSEDDPALLRYLDELDLRPGTKVTVTAVAPFDGPLTLRIDETDHVVGRQVAEAVFVKDVHTNPSPDETD
jgi:DtxR family transcriptional regulator, Mn-dependent transcriptional regulator